jgi:hypothetical protein
MRYFFTLVITAIVWLITVLIASRPGITTNDRLTLYFCLLILTAGLYKIGFSRK